MKYRLIMICTAICLTIVGFAGIMIALAAEPAVPVPENPPAISLTTMSDAQAEMLSPLNREMRNILLQEKSDVERLASRMATLNDHLAALEIQRTISDRKFRTQIELLEVRGRFARQEGKIELAKEAEAAVKALKSRPTNRGER